MRVYTSQASNRNWFFFLHVHTAQIQSFLLFAYNNHSPTLFLYLFLIAELIFFPFLDKYTYNTVPCCSYLSRIKMPLPAHKMGCLWLRIWNKDWWEVVLLHFTVAEWKESFIMTGHAFLQHFAHAQFFQFWFSIRSSVYMHAQSY